MLRRQDGACRHKSGSFQRHLSSTTGRWREPLETANGRKGHSPLTRQPSPALAVAGASVYGDDVVCRCACCLLVYSSFTIFAWMTARTRGTRVPCSFILLESCMTLHAAHTNSPSKCALTAALRSCIRYNIPTKCYFSSHDPCLSLRLLLPFVRLAEASQSTFAAGIFSTIPSCRAASPLPT